MSYRGLDPDRDNTSSWDVPVEHPSQHVATRDSDIGYDPVLHSGVDNVIDILRGHRRESESAGRGEVASHEAPTVYSERRARNWSATARGLNEAAIQRDVNRTRINLQIALDDDKQLVNDVESQLETLAVFRHKRDRASIVQIKDDLSLVQDQLRRTDRHTHRLVADLELQVAKLKLACDDADRKVADAHFEKRRAIKELERTKVELVGVKEILAETEQSLELETDMRKTTQQELKDTIQKNEEEEEIRRVVVARAMDERDQAVQMRNKLEARLEYSAEELKEAISSAEDRAKEIRQENRDMHEKVSTLTVDVSALHMKCDALVQENHSLEDQAKGYAAELAELRKDNDALKVDVDRTTAEQKRLSADLAEEQNARSSHESDRHLKESQVEEAHEREKFAKEQAVAAAEGAEDAVQQAKEARREAEHALEKLEDMREAYKSLEDQMKEERETSDREAQRWKAELRKMKERNTLKQEDEKKAQQEALVERSNGLYTEEEMTRAKREARAHVEKQLQFEMEQRATEKYELEKEVKEVRFENSKLAEYRDRMMADSLLAERSIEEVKRVLAQLQ